MTVNYSTPKQERVHLRSFSQNLVEIMLSSPPLVSDTECEVLDRLPRNATGDTRLLFCYRISPSRHTPLLTVQVNNSTRASTIYLLIDWSSLIELPDAISRSTASAMATAGALPAQDIGSSFQRNYKACDHCRLKKKRCDLGGDHQGVYGFAGPPCASCRRERRQCVFREARDTKKRHYAGRTRPVTRASGQRERFEKLQSSSQPDKRLQAVGTTLAMGTNLVDLTASAPSLPFDPSLDPAVTATSPVFQTHQSDRQGIANQGDVAIEATLTGNGLHGNPKILLDRSSRLVTDTTILKGNDAIDILLGAATGHGSSSPASPVSSQPPNLRGDNTFAHSGFQQERLGPEPNATSLHSKNSCLKLIKQGSVDANTSSAWKSSVFVRTGLLSAEHVITLLDAYETARPSRRHGPE